MHEFLLAMEFWHINTAHESHNSHVFVKKTFYLPQNLSYELDNQLNWRSIVNVFGCRLPCIAQCGQCQKWNVRRRDHYEKPNAKSSLKQMTSDNRAAFDSTKYVAKACKTFRSDKDKKNGSIEWIFVCCCIRLVNIYISNRTYAWTVTFIWIAQLIRIVGASIYIYFTQPRNDLNLNNIFEGKKLKASEKNSVGTTADPYE